MKTRTIEERAQDYYNAVFDRDLLHLMDVAEGERRPNRREREECGFDAADPETWARERIEEQGYGIETQTVCYVTLAGGGPAARLKVMLDEDGDVERASLQFCDWFESWTDAPRQEAAVVERYARLLGVTSYAQDR